MDELIRAIYLASSGLEDMDLFLDKASSVFNAHLVGCIATDRFDRSTQMPFFRGVSESDVVDYNTYFADKNILITASIRELLRGEIVSSADVFTNSELSKTEFYADYMKKQDAHYTSGFMVTSLNNTFYTLIIARPYAMGAIGEREKKMLSTLQFHARAAIHIGSHLGALKSAIRAKSGALEKLNTGVCILGSELKLLEANVAAKAFLSDGCFLTSNKGYLAGGTTPNRQLARLLHELSNDMIKSSRRVRVLDSSSGAECYLSIFPILDADEFWWVDSRQSKYVLFIGTQLKPGSTCLDFLKNEFALTRREIEVVSLLVTGSDLASIARHLQISYETARSHMKSIFRKMDIHSQAQLAVIVSRLNSVH
jgi:DNA-binding CsgD family transcriptional regulator